MQKRLKDLWIPALICVFFILYMIIDARFTETDKAEYSRLISEIQKGEVESIVMSDGVITAVGSAFPDGAEVKIPSAAAFFEDAGDYVREQIEEGTLLYSYDVQVEISGG